MRPGPRTRSPSAGMKATSLALSVSERTVLLVRTLTSCGYETNQIPRSDEAQLRANRIPHAHETRLRGLFDPRSDSNKLPPLAVSRTFQLKTCRLPELYCPRIQRGHRVSVSPPARRARALMTQNFFYQRQNPPRVLVPALQHGDAALRMLPPGLRQFVQALRQAVEAFFVSGHAWGQLLA
jgi:hypothetical protein